MDFLSTVQALLDPLAPAGAFYGEAPAEPAQDWITWQRIVSDDNVTLDGASDWQSTHTQVDIFAARIELAEAIRKSADAALSALVCVQLTCTDGWDPVVQRWRITREYSISFNES